jgi:hypothetical protein
MVAKLMGDRESLANGCVRGIAEDHGAAASDDVRARESIFERYQCNRNAGRYFDRIKDVDGLVRAQA